MAQHRPKYGPAQPTNGPAMAIGLFTMAAKGHRYIAARERRIVSENVKTRMEIRYKGRSNMVLALAEESGVGRSTVQRIVDPQTYGSYGPNVDTMDLLARALRCEAH